MTAQGTTGQRVSGQGVAGPVARVALDVPLVHLDRPFDYAVPESMSDAALPGVRVRVRFAGKDVDGFVLERVAESGHDGPLTPLRRVVSAEPVLSPDVVRLARAVADRYAGTLSDVLRLAVPPRHATTESATTESATTERTTTERTLTERSATGRGRAPVNGSEPHHSADHDHLDHDGADHDGLAWADYPAGGAFLTRLRQGESPRAVWAALPGARHWASAIVEAAAVVMDGGRGVVVVVPDRRDLDTLERAVLARFGPDRHARLEADLGTAARYRAFLACLRGQVRLVIGTRSAAFAPVADLGLVVVWDDGDDSHAEPRAPYPHTREVLAVRAEQSGAAMLIGGWTVTVESAALLRGGWARRIQAERTVRRERWARVVTADDAGGRDAPPDPGRGTGLPAAALRVVRRGLATGPVLVQVPRTGYLPAVACARCRRAARCGHCAGPVQLTRPRGEVRAGEVRVGEVRAGEVLAGEPRNTGADLVSCGWCGRTLDPWTCAHCGHPALRAVRVGVHRTAEELGRAFPGVPVLVSRAGSEPPRVSGRPAIVLATAGIEPPVESPVESRIETLIETRVEGAEPEPGRGGYAAGVLLDGDALLARADLRAGEEALRRWLGAVALVRASAAGGVVMVCAEPSAPAVQALVRLDPSGFADHELVEREQLQLPPARATASLVGDPAAVAGLLRLAELPAQTSVLGPIELNRPAADPDKVVDDGFALDPAPVRMVVRASAEQAAELAAALHAAASVRSARKERGAVRIQVDPRDIG